MTRTQAERLLETFEEATSELVTYEQEHYDGATPNTQDRRWHAAKLKVGLARGDVLDAMMQGGGTNEQEA